MIKRLLATILLVWSSSPLDTQAQDVAAEILKQNEPITVQIGGGEPRLFSIRLDAGEYATFRIEQHGIILVASLYDPQDKLVIQMDTPAGGHGPIIFSTIAASSGKFRLEVASRNKWTNPANFDVSVDEVRTAKEGDQQVVAAHQAFAEGRKIGRNNAPVALASYERSMKVWKETKNLRWQALTHFARAQIYAGIERGRPNAIKELEAGLGILSAGVAPNDWRLKASTLNDLGSLYTNTAEVERGINLLNQALDLYSQHNDRRGQASALNNLAIVQGQILGNYSLSHELTGKAVALRYAENDLPGAINLMNTLGGIADLLGEPEKALDYFSKAQRDWEKLPEIPLKDPRRLGTLINLAAMNEKLGRWEQARDLYDTALSTLGEEDSGRIDTLDYKGDLYASFGDVKKAQESYNEALALLPAEKFNPDQKARILVHLGQLWSMEGNFSNAVSMFEQARALKPSDDRLADVLTNLGTAQAAQEKLELAVETFQQALVIQKNLPSIRGQALTLQRRGEAYDRLRKPEAVDDLKRALDLWKSLKDVRGIAATLNSLARAEQGRSHLAEALAYSNEAIDVVESQRLTLSSRELRTSYFATQENYFALNVDLNMQLNRSTGDIQYLARAFEINEKSRARVLLEALKEVGVDRVDGNNVADKELADLLERRLVLMHKLAAKAAARTKLLTINRNAVQLAALDKEIDALSEQGDSLDAELRSRNRRFATLTRPRPASLKETQQQLDGETVLLEYSLGDKRSYAWTVTNDSIHGFELPGAVEIENAAKRMGEAIGLRNLQVKNETRLQKQTRETKADADYAEAARSLSGMVLEKVVPRLERRRVVLVPDGALQTVSFASLPTTKNSTADSRAAQSPTQSTEAQLLLNHEIVVLPSASVLVVLREQITSRQQAPRPMIVLANPVFGGDDDRLKSFRSSRSRNRNSELPVEKSPTEEPDSSTSQSNQRVNMLRSVGATQISPLPFSVLEAQSILKVTKGEAVAKLDFDANRSLAVSPEMGRYRYIHFATHGVVDLERPALSRIILSLVDKEGRAQDGFLFLHDIYNLNLPAELVVLSACQTGVGKQIKGEGLIALTRGFMYAGAARLVASYWDVDDAATAELMAQFYREIFLNGKKPAEALQLAQLHVRRQKRWSSPNYWAGFFIQGEWK